MILSEQFDTPESFARRIESREARWQWQDKDATHLSLSGIKTVGEALAMFDRGWPEQAQKMASLEDQLFAQLSSGVERIDPVNVECDGHALDIAAYCANQPEHWVKFEQSLIEGASNKILRVAVNIGASGHVSQETIIARGTIASSLIDALEYRGYRVELWITKATSWDANLFSWKMLAKPAEQPLDLSRVLFMTAHPAMLRRLHFALLSSIEKPSLFDAGPHGGMGCSADLPDRGQYDVYVGAQLSDSDPVRWGSQTARDAWLKQQIAKLENNCS